MKNLFLLLLFSCIVISCSSDSSEPAKEYLEIVKSTTMPNSLCPVAAGNIYVYKNSFGELVYDTLHPINKSISFRNSIMGTVISDVTCYHSPSILSYLFQDWHICGYNSMLNMFMSCWSGDPTDLIEGETISPAMFYGDSLDVGAEVGEFIYQGKEHLTINNQAYLNTLVFDNYSNTAIPDAKRVRIYLYKGVGLLKAVQVQKNTLAIIDSLVLQGCKLQ
jgi:hypothetical protein